jgi:heptosyltransferase-2/heptosyltransferase-3
VRGKGRGGPPALRAPVTPGDERVAADLLAQRGIAPADRLIAVQAGTGAALKRWSRAAFAEVCTLLAGEFAATVLLVGTADERDLAAEIAGLARARAPEAAPRVVVLAGETSWQALAAVLDRCALVVGLDSGTLHLAVARGRPSVAIFGPVDPRLFGPWGDPRTPPARHAVVVAALPCQPCGRLDYCALQPRGGPLPVPCLAAVTPAAVIAAAREVIIEEP